MNWVLLMKASHRQTRVTFILSLLLTVDVVAWGGCLDLPEAMDYDLALEVQ